MASFLRGQSKTRLMRPAYMTSLCERVSKVLCCPLGACGDVSAPVLSTVKRDIGPTRSQGLAGVPPVPRLVSVVFPGMVSVA